MISKIKFNKEKMLNAVNNSNATSTDLADWLVKEIDYPFRKAHNITGKIIQYATNKKKLLSDLSLKELQKFEKRITNKVFSVFIPQNSIKSKKSIGGVSPETVKKAIQEAEKKYL